MTPRRKSVLVIGALLFIAAGVTLVWLVRAPLGWEKSSDSASQGGTQSEPGAALKAREQHADETVWAKEMLAQRCGRLFDSFWDSLNATNNKLALAASFPIGEIVMGQWGPPQTLPHGIELRESVGPGPVLSRAQWREWIEQIAQQGWQLENIEFRHNQFDTDTNGAPLQSRFYFAANLINTNGPVRAALQGDLVVDWENVRFGGTTLSPSDGEREGVRGWDRPLGAPASVKRIDASHLTLKTRTGEPPFKLLLNETITPPQKSGYIDPLILYDLDGDGLSEVILAAKNLVYHRRGGDHYEAGPLCRYPAEHITSAVVADFDGDGFADFLCANFQGLFLFKGSRQGTFDEPGRLVWRPSQPLKYTMVVTCGDIDHDGALDVFLAQYKAPNLGAVLRPYYYDANDGWPAYLLHNDGKGNFTDVTESAGLGAKRWRRTYSASLVDLDGDGHLDLVVVSDFAGLDLYRNDGHGHFSDMTRQWVGESHEFGMAHALADFNRDGRLDLLMIGMPSPTVDRLEHLGLGRPYLAEDRQRRPAMAFGNRLYLARPGGGFEQTSMNDSIARSGWSWGCSAFDFDNDGFPDVYIANGLESKQSVKEYEPEFWLHNIFIDEKIDDVSATRYLMDRVNATRGQGWSYGGYEKNRLYLNRQGESFLEIGQLAGVALEPDCRNVVADDLDGDGRVDLLVTTFEVWPEAKQTLKVYKNALTDGGHWIGFRLREEGEGKSPVGVRVTIYYEGHSATRQIVTGDSHRSQHANTVHFGLGAAERVERAEIRWVNGQTVTLSGLAVDRYYAVSAAPAQR